ncbi:M23 family metallopeptidase [Luteipulveratus halotolerans]|uniref:M23ase beta-sheet core domain-containing protein n=1 Tax=Luteipulveratus halotolerans TaxID=1631356 RepID=A0A0L6CJJ3_9MICO|nr:M23 family metallopeptidase [Luteipulveratus halotolerans]KNX37688.1 hypothetical protein VV01_11905 [Luteipulveratus halotolerans]
MTRLRRTTVGLVTAGLLLGTAGTALADDPGSQKKKVDQAITSSVKDLDLVSSDLTKAVSALNATNGKVTAARTTFNRAEGELRSATRHHNDVAGQLKVAQSDETKNTNALKANQRAQGRTKVLVGGLARQTYMQGGMGRLEMTLQVLSSGGSEVTDNLSLADIVLRQQNGVLHRLSGQQAAGTATGNRLTAIRTRVAGLKRESSAAVTRASRARNSAARAKTALEGLQRTQAAAATTLKARKDKELADLRWLRGESTRLQRVLDARARARAKAARGRPAPAAPAPGSDGHFLAGPAPKSQIASPFGYRMHPILGIRMLHAGADFAFGCGAPVYASAAGDVVEAGHNSIAGNNIVVDHGQVSGRSLATQYEHLSAFAVRSGHVSKGQLIGRVGATGRATGCHLHYAVLSNGQYVDPAGYIG